MMASGTAYRQKPNGNTPHAREQPARMQDRSMTSPGMPEIPKMKRIPSARKNQTRGVSTTWRGTSANGLLMCTAEIITATVLSPTQPDQLQERAAVDAVPATGLADRADFRVSGAADPAAAEAGLTVGAVLAVGAVPAGNFRW